jgi:hypothetical protein
MAQKVDIEAALPAMLEAATTYRVACDDFEAALAAAKDSLRSKAAAVTVAVERGREAALDIGDPFDQADPIGKSLDQIRLIRHPIRLFCEI